MPKNGLRIFVLAMLGARVERNCLTGKLHHPGGIIYFLIALAAISFLIWTARYGGRNRRAMAETHHGGSTSLTTATDFAEGSMSARYARPLCLASFSASRAAPRAPAVSPLGIT